MLHAHPQALSIHQTTPMLPCLPPRLSQLWTAKPQRYPESLPRSYRYSATLYPTTHHAIMLPLIPNYIPCPNLHLHIFMPPGHTLYAQLPSLFPQAPLHPHAQPGLPGFLSVVAVYGQLHLYLIKAAGPLRSKNTMRNKGLGTQYGHLWYRRQMLWKPRPPPGTR